jgi:hypothetical protein
VLSPVGTPVVLGAPDTRSPVVESLGADVDVDELVADADVLEVVEALVVDD